MLRLYQSEYNVMLHQITFVEIQKVASRSSAFCLQVDKLLELYQKWLVPFWRTNHSTLGYFLRPFVLLLSCVCVLTLVLGKLKEHLQRTRETTWLKLMLCAKRLTQCHRIYAMNDQTFAFSLGHSLVMPTQINLCTEI